MREFLATVPFDLYELHLFQLVAAEGSFTGAARKAGLTQSTMTRQIAGMEAALGVALFERTTRAVNLTSAGELLCERAGLILDQVSSTIEDLHDRLGLLPRMLHLGISRSISFAYLPGFIFKFQREATDVQINLMQDSSRRLLELLDERSLDVAIICAGPRLPRGLEIVHRFADDFSVIVPSQSPIGASKVTPGNAPRVLRGQRWLMIRRESATGSQLFSWLQKHGMQIEPAMELDSFDLIVNMVGLGLGASVVPNRALPLYLQRRKIRKITLRPRFSREIAVVMRKTNQPRPHVKQFIESILF
jgi:DNA-binding transcriptional LysR family regulator